MAEKVQGERPDDELLALSIVYCTPAQAVTKADLFPKQQSELS